MKNNRNEKPELIVVFKKNIGLEVAKRVLDKGKGNYRKGMDSSRGKLYFYNTGPKFILTFETEEDKQHMKTELEALHEIHDVYTPDWDKCKD